MKNLLALAILFFSTALKGQVSIDVRVASEFDSLFRIQPKDIQEKSSISGFEKGFALIIDGGTDTLNLDQLVHPTLDTSTNPVFIDIDTSNEILESNTDTARFNQWLACAGAMSKDTFIIATYFGFFAGSGTITKISNGHSNSEYFAYIDQSKIYRKKLEDKKESSINVTAIKENIILNKFPKRQGDVIYGKISIETEPFYEDSSYTFSSGYIHQKCRITFLFKCEISEIR